jgi:hypothetical protein
VLAAALFAVALALGYLISASGQAEPAAPALGTRGVQLELRSTPAAAATLGDAARLPALAERPPAPEPSAPATVTEEEEPLEPAEPTVSEPVTPVPVAPAPTPAPAPAPPPVDFDDSG